MKYISLGSGSKGNATLIMEQQQAILIDCGFSRKAVLDRIALAGVDASLLSAVFVTHEHGDHAKGVQVLCEKLAIPFFASFGTARKMGWLEHPLWRCLYADKTESIGKLAVMPVVVPHDAEEPMQFVVENSASRRLGVLSDLGSLTAHVISSYSDCHGLQIEANHDVQMLMDGTYPPSLKARVASDFGHLNNQQTAELLQRVNWHGVQHITAGHISEKNNSRELVSIELSQALDCSPDEVKLLGQDEISFWLELT